MSIKSDFVNRQSISKRKTEVSLETLVLTLHFTQKTFTFAIHKYLMICKNMKKGKLSIPKEGTRTDN